jgi:Protein of unknown function (DUF3137)
MATALIVTIFVLFAAIVIGFAVLSAIAARRRRDEFRAFAASKGWSYAQRDDRWATHFNGAPFGQGHSIKAGNVLTGQYDGRNMVAFDYVYYTTEHSTDAQGHSHTREESHPYAVVAVDCGVTLPDLRVTPEGLFSRFFGKLLNKDIELESEDFNRAFTVTCDDRKFASDVLHPRMMELLLTYRDIGWGFNGSWILAYEPGENSLAELQRRLQALDQVLDNVPEFVWRDRKGPTT